LNCLSRMRRNVGDFAGSPVPVVTPEELLAELWGTAFTAPSPPGAIPSLSC